MKKTLLAAAVLASFSGAALAQSTSVTLYGILDAGIGYNKVKTNRNADSISRVGMISGAQSSSRWGLRGSESLGDGLRVVFQVESGFNSSNGRSGQGDRLFARQATLGLAGEAWGTLEIGRQTNMASKYFGAIDPFGAGFGQANLGHGVSAANAVRYDNLVLYRTPDFNGFQAGIGYSFAVDSSPASYTLHDTATGATDPVWTSKHAAENFRTSDNARALTLGLSYANGPLGVALSYDQLRQVHGWGLQSTRVIDPLVPNIVKVDHARADVFDYIEWFYNPKRRHSYLGNVSPVKFEQLYFLKNVTV